MTLLGLVHRLEESLEAEGLQEIVADLKFVPFQGVFFVSGGDDDQWLLIERAQKIQPLQFGPKDTSFAGSVPR